MTLGLKQSSTTTKNSFAIITDLHIGEGQGVKGDYNGGGWDDNAAGADDSNHTTVRYLKESIEVINKSIKTYKINLLWSLVT